MKKIEILVVGKQPQIMPTILRLVNNNPEWNGSIAFSANEAIEKSQTIAFSIVLLGAGLIDDETQLLKDYFTVPIVQHYGGGSGLLTAEIYQALSSL